MKTTVEVKQTFETPIEVLEAMKSTQSKPRYFNELGLNLEEQERRLQALERRGVNVVKYTNGDNYLISVNNKIYDGVGILS